MKLATAILLILFGVVTSLSAQTDSGEKHWTDVSKKVKKLTRQLPKEDMILGRAVGAEGAERPPYKAFQELVNIATLDELVALTKHKNPIIRGYAFWGLVLRDRERAKAIKSQLDSDTEVVNTNLHGCIPTPYKISEFASFLLRIPDEHMVVYYDKKE